MGIIVNRPIDLNLAGLFDKIDIKLEAEALADLPVYFGGPVQPIAVSCCTARSATGNRRWR